MTITNRFIYFDIWEWINPELVVQVVKKFPYRAVIMDGLKEHTPFWGYSKRNLYELTGILDENKTKLYCLSSAKNNYTPDFPDLLYEYVEFVNVPLFWLHTTDLNLREKNTKAKKDKNKKNHFFSLINKSHDHRCSLIDSLYKNKCFEYGKHTWNELNDTFKFKYWEQKIIHSNDEYSETKDNYLLNDNEYRDSAIDLVMESTSTCIFYSEKTFKCILTKKPFLLFGGENINNQLKDFGFKLFDNVIDYSFDRIVNVDERADALSAELKRICEKYTPTELYLNLYSTAEYNNQHAHTLIKNRHQYYPQTLYYIKELVKDPFLQQKIDFNTYIF